MKTAMQRLNTVRVEILKMDIEGAEEYAVPAFFEGANETSTPACQLMMETHNGVDDWRRPLKYLDSRGFLLFSKEFNEQCGVCAEFSFVHMTCLEKYGLTLANVVGGRNF